MTAAQPRPFGELLREYRVKAGLTQEELAERAQMSLAAIGKLERGARQRPYRPTIALLANALDLLPDDRLELERAARNAQPLSPAPPEAATTIRLPAYLSSFVGRERDTTTVCDMLTTHRLVTLVGVAGVGKTRLAVRSAMQFVSATVPGRKLDGAWFIDFSSIDNQKMIAMALALGIGIDGCTTVDGLVSYLRLQHFLLVLDNCEHLLDPIAAAANDLIVNCPGARILATSRQALSLDGERIYQVPPLDLSDAIQLFKHRAEAIDSRFRLTDAISAAVTDICERVDGIALAIELAAARTNAFSPAAIAAQIEERFSLLAGGLRSSFDWSYALLDDRESRLFRRSSIFTGGFTLDLLSGLFGPSDRRDISLILASLVDKSLVQSDINLEPTRYRLLEPTRQYAHEKLCESGEYEGAARSHALALLALAENFDSKLELIPDRDWDAYVERERDNFRAAFEWSFGPHGDLDFRQRLAASRTATWGGFKSGEIRKFMNVALGARSKTSGPVLARLANNAARTAIYFERDPEVKLETCRRALSLQRPGDFRGIATARYFLGVTLGNMGRYDEADVELRHARESALSAGAQYEYNVATVALGTYRFGAGDLREARDLTLEGLLQSEAAMADRNAAQARMVLAEIEFASGHVEEALRLNKIAAHFFLAHSDLTILPKTFSNSAAYLIALGRYEEARHDANDALRRARMFGSVISAFWATQHLATLAVLQATQADDTTLRRAAKVLGFVDHTIVQWGKRRFYTEQFVYEKALFSLREALGQDELAALMAAGKAWSDERAFAEALAL